MTPSVAAPGDTNPSDATGTQSLKWGLTLFSECPLFNFFSVSGRKKIKPRQSWLPSAMKSTRRVVVDTLLIWSDVVSRLHRR